jgi:hypothetical protein
MLAAEFTLQLLVLMFENDAIMGEAELGHDVQQP